MLRLKVYILVHVVPDRICTVPDRICTVPDRIMHLLDWCASVSESTGCFLIDSVEFTKLIFKGVA